MGKYYSFHLLTSCRIDVDRRRDLEAAPQAGEPIPTCQLCDQRFVVAVRRQRLEQARYARDISYELWNDASIEVRAEPRTVFANMLEDGRGGSNGSQPIRGDAVPSSRI